MITISADVFSSNFKYYIVQCVVIEPIYWYSYVLVIVCWLFPSLKDLIRRMCICFVSEKVTKERARSCRCTAFSGSRLEPWRCTADLVRLLQMTYRCRCVVNTCRDFIHSVSNEHLSAPNVVYSFLVVTQTRSSSFSRSGSTNSSPTVFHEVLRSDPVFMHSVFRLVSIDQSWSINHLRCAKAEMWTMFYHLGSKPVILLCTCVCY